MNEDGFEFDANMKYEEVKTNKKYGKWNHIYHFGRGNYMKIVEALMKKLEISSE